MKASVHSFLFALLGCTLFVSCDRYDNCCVPPPATSSPALFIVNAGNFGQANGELSAYDESSGALLNGVVKTANSGSEIGAGIESFYIHEKRGYIICNAPDKIEVLDSTLRFAANPITGLITPRYMAATGNTAYVSCWGPYGPNFDLPDSYVAVIDLNTLQVIDTVQCGQGPEGLHISGDNLYIANSFENSITVYNAGNRTYKSIMTEAAPQYFEKDGQGKIWASITGLYGAFPSEKTGFAVIDPITQTVEASISAPGISEDGQMTTNASLSMILFLKAEPWPGTGTSVYQVNTVSRQVMPEALIRGENFYGIGLSKATGWLYITDTKGFMGNGELLVYSPSLALIDSKITGIGPWNIVFTE